jgi:hypothetical protein
VFLKIKKLVLARPPLVFGAGFLVQFEKHILDRSDRKMTETSASTQIDVPTVEIISTGDSSELPTWNLTFKRRQKMIITFFSFLGYVKMIEGKKDNAKGQEDYMEKAVAGLIDDWVENKGKVSVQGVDVDLLAVHFEKMIVKTTAGKVCVANYSKYTAKKQVKYQGRQLLAFAKLARKLIQRDAYPKWLEVCDKKAADKTALAGPRSGQNYDQILEQVRVASWAMNGAEEEDSDAEEGADTPAIIDGDAACSAAPADFKPAWWYVFTILGPWGAHRFGFGLESLLAPVKSATNGPDEPDCAPVALPKKQEQSRRHQQKQAKLDSEFEKKKESVKAAVDARHAEQRAVMLKALSLDEARFKAEGLKNILDMLSKPSVEELDSDEDIDVKEAAKKERKLQLKIAQREYRALIMGVAVADTVSEPPTKRLNSGVPSSVGTMSTSTKKSFASLASPCVGNINKALSDSPSIDYSPSSDVLADDHSVDHDENVMHTDDEPGLPDKACATTVLAVPPQPPMVDADEDKPSPRVLAAVALNAGLFSRMEKTNRRSDPYGSAFKKKRAVKPKKPLDL